MNETLTAITALTIAEQQDINGGVTEGGCIDPVMQRLIDILSGRTPA